MRLVERRVGVWLRTAAARLIAECGDPSCGQCGVTPILDGPAFNELREQHEQISRTRHSPFLYPLLPLEISDEALQE